MCISAIADIAVRVMLSSFIGAQKFSVMRTLEHRFRRYMNYRLVLGLPYRKRIVTCWM